MMCGRPKNTNRNSKPILQREYKILKSYINGMDTFETTKTKWLRSLELLYMSGMRVSEILDVKISDIISAIEKTELSVVVKKQQIIRHIPLSDKSAKILKQLIKDESDMDDYFIHKRNNVRCSLNPNGFTKEFNDLIQLVLGKNIHPIHLEKALLPRWGYRVSTQRLFSTSYPIRIFPPH
jgi:site-specific recombinase XerD